MTLASTLDSYLKSKRERGAFERIFPWVFMAEKRPQKVNYRIIEAKYMYSQWENQTSLH
jgi:hypothetical protein